MSKLRGLLRISSWLFFTGMSGYDFWTSGNEIEQLRSWKWASTNQPFSYVSWAPDEPGSFCYDGGCCVILWANENLNFDDVDCATGIKKRFICETKPIA